ncbi:HEPN domain-containing protein [Seonamhaeicola aphaedonensis]|uniref:HEPN domain-containing protein n=1 Tax=Seonamhaeicola aphaedonensis TaxID=1461338 RepID=A0A3D9H5J3_9FLAO|nr:HEPN domain-containing protein [Seonamhaeicola aphaedonensis]RED44760.1 HEPN domain-containing protein [Seonamhaeicola aphaedonensis]
MESNADKLFSTAKKKLNEANKELYKPEEDIVAYSVCKNSQYAIDNYLRGFLTKKGIDTTDLETISQLYETCKKMNKNFEKIDLTNFQCIYHIIDSKYCNEYAKVNSCFATADNLDSFLKKEKII